MPEPHVPLRTHPGQRGDEDAHPSVPVLPFTEGGPPGTCPARPGPLLPCKGGFLGHKLPAGGGWELRRALPAAESSESGLCCSWQPLLCLTSNAPVGPERRTRLPASAAAAAMPYLARRAIASLLPARSKVVNKQLGLCSLSPAQGRPRPLDLTAGSKRGLEAEEPPWGNLPAFKSYELGFHPWLLLIPHWVRSSHLPAWGSRGGSQERAESITSGWASSGDGGHAPGTGGCKSRAGA